MIVLFYHLISPRELPHLRPLYRCKTPRARRSLLFRFARTRERPCLGDLRNPDSPLARAAGEIRLQYCDGDTAFT